MGLEKIQLDHPLRQYPHSEVSEGRTYQASTGPTPSMRCSRYESCLVFRVFGLKEWEQMTTWRRPYPDQIVRNFGKADKVLGDHADIVAVFQTGAQDQLWS